MPVETLPPPFDSWGRGVSLTRRKAGKEGVCGAKVCNPKPASDLLHPVGVKDYQSA